MTTEDRPKPSGCPECGALFHCGLADPGGCWCARLPALEPDRYDAAGGCLCEACLLKRLANDAVAATR
jgi:hypothetical protein